MQTGDPEGVQLAWEGGLGGREGPLQWHLHRGLRAGPEPVLFCSPCGPFSSPLLLPPRCQVRPWRRQVCVNLALRVSGHPGCHQNCCIYLPGSDSRDVFPAALGVRVQVPALWDPGRQASPPVQRSCSYTMGGCPVPYTSEQTPRVWQVPLAVTGCSVLCFGTLRGRGHPALGMKGSGKGSVQEGPSPKGRPPGELHEVQAETQI